MTVNFNHITLDITKTTEEKKKRTLKIPNDPIFYYFIRFYPSSILSILFLELRCLSGSNGNLPHSDEVVSVASKQSLRKNKYETLCLIQVFRSSPGCCIYTSHLTANWLKRQECLTQRRTHARTHAHSKPEAESTLLPVHQQTRPGTCTAAARPCCWCWSPPASAHQQWFCPPDPAEKAATPTQVRERERHLWTISTDRVGNDNSWAHGAS